MANRKFYYQNKNRNANKSERANVAREEAIAKQTEMYSAEALATSLADLGISESTRELLNKNRIENASDLVRRTEKEMYKVQGLNKKILFELKDALRAHDMAFRPEEANAPKKNAEVASDKTANDRKNRQNPRQDNRQDNKQDNRQGNKDQNKKADSNAADSKRVSKFGLSDRREARGAAQQKQPAEQPKKLTQPLPVAEWRKVIKGGKWGFSDGFKIVVPTMYDEVFAFKDGLASVELNEKCGYIDEQNNIVIPFDYDMAMSFSEGLACVAKGEKCGYINKNNEVVFSFEYDAATAFENGEAKIKKDGKWGTLSKETGSIVWI